MPGSVTEHLCKNFKLKNSDAALIVTKKILSTSDRYLFNMIRPIIHNNDGTIINKAVNIAKFISLG